MKDQYRNKGISYLTSSHIIEYDISSAGYSLSRYYKLLSDKKLEWLGSLDKKSRHIQIGLLCRNDDVYNKRLKEAFMNIRREFFIANDIRDEDILSIKKDAIFLTKFIDTTQFGEYVTFSEKNIYTSYYYINKKEFYDSPTKLDVKGISDDKLELHRDYMLDFLHNIFRLAETTDAKYIVKQLVGFTNAYKSRDLEIGYYRELNDESMFRLSTEYLKFHLGLQHVNDVSDVNISYNYMNYIRPLIEIFM